MANEFRAPIKWAGNNSAPVDAQFSSKDIIFIACNIRRDGDHVVLSPAPHRIGAEWREGSDGQVHMVLCVERLANFSLGDQVLVHGGGTGEVLGIWEGCAWVKRRGADIPITVPFDRLNKIAE